MSFSFTSCISTGSFIIWLHVPPPPTCSFIRKNLTVASLENLTDSAKSELNAFSHCPHIPLFTVHDSFHIKLLSWLPYLGAFNFFFFFNLAALSLSCGTWDIWSLLQHVGSSSLTRVKLGPSVLGAGCLSHWTTREVPRGLFLTWVLYS